MEFTRHAAMRTQQRGFQADDIDLIINFGTPIKKPGNAVEYRMRKKDEKRLVQSLDRIKGKAVLMAGDTSKILTVYNINKKNRGGVS